VVRQALGRSAALGGGAAKAIAASSLKYRRRTWRATHQEAEALKTVKALGVAVLPFAYRRADRIKMLLARAFVQASRKPQLHGHVHAFGPASRNLGGVSGARQMGTIQHISAQPRFASVQSAGTRSLFWLRDRSSRPLDALHLAYHSDNFPPRTWYLRPEPEPYSTITMSIYFHATEEDCAAAGNDYILIDAFGTRAESSTVGARANMWSRGGVLLATTEQMGWFR